MAFHCTRWRGAAGREGAGRGNTATAVETCPAAVYDWQRGCKVHPSHVGSRGRIGGSVGSKVVWLQHNKRGTKIAYSDGGQLAGGEFACLIIKT